MPIIKKPLLAGSFDPTKAVFPYIATPKIDGIRFLMVNGVAVSRTFKPIRNNYIQEKLQETFPDGIDGELTSGDTFQSSTSAVMSIDGSPKFKAWVFDYVDPDDETILPYHLRMLNMPTRRSDDFEIEYLLGTPVPDMEALDDLERDYLENGFEGVMLRSPYGTYKFGRGTVKENILLKLKRFEDDEAILIGIDEKMSNQNLVM
jgi:DNA ligase-1